MKQSNVVRLRKLEEISEINRRVVSFESFCEHSDEELRLFETIAKATEGGFLSIGLFLYTLIKDAGEDFFAVEKLRGRLSDKAMQAYYKHLCTWCYSHASLEDRMNIVYYRAGKILEDGTPTPGNVWHNGKVLLESDVRHHY